MKHMPFYSQVVNWDDEDSGFPDLEAARQWEPNCCGIACLRMILSYYHADGEAGSTSYWALLQRGLARGAYSERGWIHRGLLEMAGEFGVRGRCHRQADLAQVVAAIQGGSVCIVSVTRYFLGGQPDADGSPLARGGHLVVAYDTLQDAAGVSAIICNHPSSGRPWNKAAWPVEVHQWERSMSGNYIEFFPGQGELSSTTLPSR